MKEQYYLVSQLPDIASAGERSVLPITEKYYRDLCTRFFDEKARKALDMLSLEAPKIPEPTGSAFLDKWYDFERALRYALVQVRAQKLKKDAGSIPVSITADIVQAARTAVGMDSPLSAEQFLYEFRLSYLSNIQPLEYFSTDAVLAYGIRLLLLERIKKFDKEKGTSSYHKIYDNILGEKA